MVLDTTLQGTAYIVYNLFENPKVFSQWGLRGEPFVLAGNIIGWSINILIIASTASFCLESVEAFSPDMNRNPESYEMWEERWWALECTGVILFTCDWVVRGVGAFAAGYGRDFIGDSLNWIDFASIAPFYARIFVRGFWDLRFLRVLRLTRILQNLPSAKHGSLTSVITDILRTSLGALIIPLYFMTLSLVVFSSVMFHVEKTTSYRCHLGSGVTIDPWDTANTTAGNEGCNVEFGCICPGHLALVTYDGAEWTKEMFTSIPDAMWWCMVTFTTVGYGDRYPRTTVGRIVCVMTIFCGIFFLAMPLTIIGSAFAASWQRLQEKKLAAEAHERQISGVWKANLSLVVRNRTNIRAHMLRVHELLEAMSQEAMKNGAGPAVQDQWEVMLTEIASTKGRFEHVMSLYRLPDIALTQIMR